MKTNGKYLILSLLLLSSATCGAGTSSVVQNFNTMYNASPKQLTVTNSNQTGTTDFVTYTCSSGAEFFKEAATTGNNLAIYIEANAEQVVTTQIAGLDSLTIRYYYPSGQGTNDMTVSYSTTGSAPWTSVATKYISAGVRSVKLPATGDYYIKINGKSSKKVYIYELEYTYILSNCPNCFIYQP